MRTIESLILAVAFIAFNVWLIGQMNVWGFGLLAQLLVAWFVTGVLLFCGYVWNEERNKNASPPN